MPEETRSLIVTIPPSVQVRIVLILATFALGVTLLATFALSGQSLRLDEAQSLMQTSQSPKALLLQLGQNVHVPLYHFTLHVWQVMFGNGVETSRFLSLLFFAASIPLMYKVGKRGFNPAVGLLAATLFAISPIMNWYGSEIRMYTMLVFVTLINQYYFFGLLQRGWERSWVGYLLSALVGIFTHYFFFLTLFTQAVFFFARKSLFPNDAFRRFLVLTGLLAVAFLPWVVHVLRLQLGLGSNADPNLPAPTAVNIFNTFSAFLFGFQTDAVNTAIVSLWPLLLILGLLLLRKHVKYPAESLYAALSFLVPVAVAFIASVTVVPLFETRYLLVGIPGFYLLIAWLLQQYPRGLSRFLTVLLIFGMLASLVIQTVSARTPVKENYRAAAEYLTENARPDDVVVISAPFTIYPIEYYYDGPAALVTLPVWNPYTSSSTPNFEIERLPEEAEEVSANRARVWLLLSYDQGYEEEVRLYFEQRYERLEQVTFSTNLELYLYKTRYD